MNTILPASVLEIPGMCPGKILGNSGNVPDIFQKFPGQLFGTATSQGCRIHPLAETTARPISSFALYKPQDMFTAADAVHFFMAFMAFMAAMAFIAFMALAIF